ncbi:MAG: Phenylacetic acid catabolic protein [Acidobacteriota bacterium]
MAVREALLPKLYHAAVEDWRDTFLPDYGFLLENWQKYFPKEPGFKLCAYRELGVCGEIECGAKQGQPKATKPSELDDDQAKHLLGAIRAQASTEFGSIQQHRLTLARAQNEEDQMWVLRMMAEELRHGYQMLHLLVDDDWSCQTKQSRADMVEEILSMQTGSHVLGAFNIDFDSFVDNVVFCCLIDRVGKYQLSMQRISAYQPMAESMPQMLREEAFHLATGVVPLRRWVEQAAHGDVFVTMGMLQKALNKWLPRGLEMFGDERGGGSNVRMGLKPMKNAEAQQQYLDEVQKVVLDLNVRFVRAHANGLSIGEARAAVERLLEHGGTEHGVDADDLLRLPNAGFFRRRGVPAFSRVGVDGETYEDVDAYLRHLSGQLPESYLAGRDFLDYVATLRRVEAGELTADEGARQMPELRRVAGSCPCSRAVRWVRDEPVSVADSSAADHPMTVDAETSEPVPVPA